MGHALMFKYLSMYPAVDIRPWMVPNCQMSCSLHAKQLRGSAVLAPADRCRRQHNRACRKLQTTCALAEAPSRGTLRRKVCVQYSLRKYCCRASFAGKLQLTQLCGGGCCRGSKEGRRVCRRLSWIAFRVSRSVCVFQVKRVLAVYMCMHSLHITPITTGRGAARAG